MPYVPTKSSQSIAQEIRELNEKIERHHDAVLAAYGIDLRTLPATTGGKTSHCETVEESNV